MPKRKKSPQEIQAAQQHEEFLHLKALRCNPDVKTKWHDLQAETERVNQLSAQIDGAVSEQIGVPLSPRLKGMLEERHQAEERAKQLRYQLEHHHKFPPEFLADVHLFFVPCRWSWTQLQRMTFKRFQMLSGPIDQTPPVRFMPHQEPEVVPVPDEDLEESDHKLQEKLYKRLRLPRDTEELVHQVWWTLDGSKVLRDGHLLTAEIDTRRPLEEIIARFKALWHAWQDTGWIPRHRTRHRPDTREQDLMVLEMMSKPNATFRRVARQLGIPVSTAKTAYLRACGRELGPVRTKQRQKALLCAGVSPTNPLTCICQKARTVAEMCDIHRAWANQGWGDLRESVVSPGDIDWRSEEASNLKGERYNVHRGKTQKRRSRNGDED